MLRVGLTGGLACGKSFVGKVLEGLGCVLIQADELGHQVLGPTGEAFAPVLQEFGPEILDGDGAIDRKKLAAVVFSAPEKLARLSAIVHPAVARREAEILADVEKTNPNAIVVVEAAILVETGSYRKFDRLILVECTPEQQLERAMRRDSYKKEEAMARISRQMPIEDKRRVAHYVVDTTKTKEDTIEQTREVYRRLRSIQA